MSGISLVVEIYLNFVSLTRNVPINTMAITISESTFQKICEYLATQAPKGDAIAQELLTLLPTPGTFPKQVFKAWQELTDLHIGENSWSYPVAFGELAEQMSMPIEQFVQYLEAHQIDGMQLLGGRGQSYKIRRQEVGDLTFHSAPNFTKPVPSSEVVSFAVGDRIRVNAKRPQYTNQTGTINQVISVSCRVQLDNGWVAFLPNHCLEKI